MKIGVKNNLYLTCNKSGVCCKGTVFLTRDEFTKLSGKAVVGAGINIVPFKVDYGYFYRGVYIVMHLALSSNISGYCPFLENGLCKIYEERPLMCKAYPVRIEDVKGKITYYVLADFCSNCNGQNCFSYDKGEELIMKGGKVVKEKKKLLDKVRNEVAIQYNQFFRRFLEKLEKKAPQIMELLVQSAIMETAKGNDTYVDIFTTGLFFEIAPYLEKKGVDIQEFLNRQEKLRQKYIEEPIFADSIKAIQEIKKYFRR